VGHRAAHASGGEAWDLAAPRRGRDTSAGPGPAPLPGRRGPTVIGPQGGAVCPPDATRLWAAPGRLAPRPRAERPREGRRVGGRPSWTPAASGPGRGRAGAATRDLAGHDGAVPRPGPRRAARAPPGSARAPHAAAPGPSPDARGPSPAHRAPRRPPGMATRAARAPSGRRWRARQTPGGRRMHPAWPRGHGTRPRVTPPADAHGRAVARPAPAAATGGRRGALHATRPAAGEAPGAPRLARPTERTGGRVVPKRAGERAGGAGRGGGVPPGAPPGHQVSSAQATRGGDHRARSRPSGRGSGMTTQSAGMWQFLGGEQKSFTASSRSDTRSLLDSLLAISVETIKIYQF
jgi:hypothetical protein